MRLFLKFSFIILFSLATLGWMWQSPAVKNNREANKLYSEGKVDEALSKWRDAQIESPDKKELHYNIGNALHQQEKYEDAFKEYEKALDTKDAELQARVYYNMGNTNYRMGNLPEAIEDYKKVLDINPDDEDAKYNIEFVRKKIKENLKKQEAMQEDMQKSESKESQGQEEKTQESEKAEQEKQARMKQDKETDEKEREEEKQSKAKEEEEKQDLKESAKEEDKEGEMSEQDAVRLLDALKDDEKDLQKELRIQPGEGRYRVDKDW